MEDRRLAVHRTIVVVDVEGFGDRRRTNRHQVAVREGLYRAMREAFDRSGIPWADSRHEDRGDGMFILAPPEIPKSLFAESLPSALGAALREHNDTHPGQERVRLRMALHAGEVHYDEHGVTGASVNLAFRLVDAGELKAALAGSPGVLAVIASSWFFEEVVRHSAVDTGAYRSVSISLKETTTKGWVSLPDQGTWFNEIRPVHAPGTTVTTAQPAALSASPPAVPDTQSAVGRPYRRSMIQAFTDGLGGVFDIFGGLQRQRQSPPAFEDTLAEDARALCLELGITPRDGNGSKERID